MSRIQILVGSVNGTALQSAHAVAHVLNHQGHTVRVNAEPSASNLGDDSEEVLLICCSTTGEGELPRIIYPLYLALVDERIDLHGRNYGIIALGDSGYRCFAQAGYMMEEALYRCGGKRIGEILTLDAKTTANHPLAAAQWANGWVALLAEQLA
jgi:flavodoxin